MKMTLIIDVPEDIVNDDFLSNKSKCMLSMIREVDPKANVKLTYKGDKYYINSSIDIVDGYILRGLCGFAQNEDLAVFTAFNEMIKAYKLRMWSEETGTQYFRYDKQEGYFIKIDD